MKWQSGDNDRDRFSGKLIHLQEQLYFYALQLTENRENAKDLVQETSYKALKSKSRLNNNDHIRAWLYTILKNTYINYLRSGHHRQLVMDNEDLSNTCQLAPDTSGQMPDEILLNKELREIISSLPMVYERPLNLYLTGYSYKEISNKMNIPIGTVKSRIHLGKRKIRNIYTS